MFFFVIFFFSLVDSSFSPLTAIISFQALAKALGDRKGIHRFGDFCAPLDEALVHVVLVISFPNKSLFLLDFLYLTVLKLKLCE
jgi:imidazoleglycerol phosphate dehydratase HisB